MGLETAVYTFHTAFAALWVGSVLFVSTSVLPLAIDGDVAPDVFGTVVARLQWLTRISAVVLFATGGHLAGTLYTVGTLTGTGRGYLVLAMLGLWLALAAAIEVGSARALRGVDHRKIREPARQARPFYRLGSLFAIGLLVVAGLLGGPSPAI